MQLSLAGQDIGAVMNQLGRQAHGQVVWQRYLRQLKNSRRLIPRKPAHDDRQGMPRFAQLLAQRRQQRCITRQLTLGTDHIGALPRQSQLL